MINKICLTCKFELDPSSFHKNKTKKDGLQNICISCKSLWSKQYHQENKEEKSNKRKIYYKKNKDKEIKYHQDYMALPENKEKKSQRMKQYRKDFPEIKRRSEGIRRAKAKGNEHSPYTEAEMFERYGTVCYLCNEQIDLEALKSSGAPGYERSLWKDHVIAIANGGPDTLDNVKPSHAICNKLKGNTEMYEI